MQDDDSALRLRPRREARGCPRPRRALLAVLGLSGLRNAEATSLEWRHLDFTHNRLVIGDAKTQAGRREVQISPFLRRELEQHRLGCGDAVRPTGLVFPTRTGRVHSRQNVNNKIVHPVVALTDIRRAERGDAPLPSGITAHTFRRTYVTLCAQFGRSLAYVQSQVGRTMSTRPTATTSRAQHGKSTRRSASCCGSFCAVMQVDDSERRRGARANRR